ncbi:lipopolysaccharide biosynthesis protein [Heyndrickxia sporothermodurans]|uniref:lipopolysaccharide biosynthesis protein n=1 Tax=Heyndrickxia sporothermodurans TaxID=46224 RepID=UPI002E1F4FF3|nr:lipopolysaccharide biosynthesis protein [Heyndrickxia sporothermodurans]
MNEQHSKLKILSSLFWKLMERGGTQGIQFIVQIFLARLLLPKDYGLLSLIVFFLTIANVFVQSGFNTALIQKKDADEVDFSSVLYLSIFVAGILYVCLFISSPFIADFFKEPQLVPVLKVLSVTLFIGAFNSIQNAFVAKKMLFKKLFYSSLGASVASGTVGIIAAYLGWGVWALVGQQLTNQLCISIILWCTIKWRPKLLFSIERVKVLFKYGWKILVSVLIDTIYMNLRSLFIGKLYSPAMLGYYNRGKQFPELIVTNINGSIQSVMLPALASYQDNKKKVKDMMRRSIITSSFIMFPIMVGLAVTAEPMIRLLLTDKWLPAVPFLQIYCASFALWPIHTANLQAINALGHSNIFLRLEIIKKAIGLIILISSIPFGIYALAWGVVITGVISTFINAYPNLKLLNYSYREQIKDIIPSFCLSLIMGVLVYPINFLNIAVWEKLLLQILVGACIYIGASTLFKIESFVYLVTMMKTLIKGRRTKTN